MGTDIHLQVEVRGEDGVWKTSPRKPFKTYGDEGFSWDDDPSGRHYDLFAFLADVRNGFGFGGVVRGARIEPQFPGRGLPKDYSDPKPLFKDDEDEDEDEVSPKLLSDSKHEGTSVALPEKRPYTEYTGGDFYLGDHSFTHATLEELRACDWNLTFKSTGYVGLVDYLEFKKKGQPNSWCGDVSGPGITKFEDVASFEAYMAKATTKAGFTKVQDQDHLSRLLDNQEIAGAHVRIFWKWQPLAKCRFKKWIFGDMMQGLADEFGGPQNVRVIMGFDS
jgi:hypothetical protein